MQKFLARLLPFVMLGIALVAFAFGLILLMYLFVFGAIVGAALFIANWIKQKWFPSKNIVRYKSSSKTSGRIIDHDK